MELTQLCGSNTLLNYALLSAPSPLQVSPQSGPLSVATLTFVVSCPVAVVQVTVKQITFNFAVGSPSDPQPTDLTETAAGITSSVSSSGTDQWQIAAGAASGSFVLTPSSGNGVIDTQALTVTFDGIQVGPIVGTTLVNIVEEDGGTGTVPLVTTIAVPKFPYGVFVGNFAASTPMISHGGTVALSWNGTVGPRYTILWATNSQDVSQVNTWTSPALNDTTTFILQVVAQESGQSVTIQFSVTVIVADPDIIATTLDVLQTSTLAGDVTIGSTTANANLEVNGALTANVTSQKAQFQSTTGDNNDDYQLNLLNTVGIATSRAGLALTGAQGSWRINADNSVNALNIYTSTLNPIVQVSAGMSLTDDVTIGTPASPASLTVSVYRASRRGR